MIYLCYDTALNEEYTLLTLLQKYPDSISLFQGTDDEDIWDAAPYLFKVTDNFYELRKDPFIRLDHCLLFETNETKEEVCRFLQYYMFQKSAQHNVYVRIWDARVLVKHFHVWDEKERLKFFYFFKAVYTEQERNNGLNKWQLSALSKPVATTVLSEEVLGRSGDVPGDLQTGNTANAGSVKNEDIGGQPEETVSTATGDQPPKRRRFFLE